MIHYDKFGTRITVHMWAALLEDDQYRQIASTEVDGALVSTVWVGIDHNWGDGPPLIFETTVFWGRTPSADDEERYSSIDDALAGHWRHVQALQGREQT